MLLALCLVFKTLGFRGALVQDTLSMFIADGFSCHTRNIGVPVRRVRRIHLPRAKSESSIPFFRNITPHAQTGLKKGKYFT